MRLIVPTNWDNKLIDRIKNYPVDILYGKFKRDSIGGGRPAQALPDVTKKQAEEHIRKAHDAGIKFNYVLNATCLGNQEFLKSYQSKILNEIEWIASQKVDYVTVSIPYLMYLIQKNFPELNIVASVFLNIDSIQKAKYYENLGIKEIVIDQSQNRNFTFLKQLNKTIDTDIQLVVNNICLLLCPFRSYHQNINSHASQYDSKSTKNVSDSYVTMSCESIRISQPEEIIKSPWIRPEDLIEYEKIGIKRFKISGRTKNTDWIVKVVTAYSNRKSPDNLAEIISFPLSSTLPSTKIEIKNKYLNKFINNFINKDCRYIECSKCKLCYNISKKAVVLNKSEAQKNINFYKEKINKLAL